MTDTLDLWPDFKPEKIITPKIILLEQASLLSKKTNNLINAEISTFAQTSEKIGITFKLNAPALNNYSYTLLRVYHAILFSYPCEIKFQDRNYEAKNEEDFKINLKVIFNDPETIKVITALYTQSMAQDPPVEL